MNHTAEKRLAPSMLRPSIGCKAFIKRFEELRLKAYQDQGGVWTIGWGHTGGVQMGDLITQEQAESFFKNDLSEPARVLAAEKGVELYQHEYDALVSFIYNVGAAQWSTSTMRRALKIGRHDLAADEFKRWNKVKGKISRGLARRRHEEEMMFREASYRA